MKNTLEHRCQWHALIDDLQKATLLINLIYSKLVIFLLSGERFYLKYIHNISSGSGFPFLL